MSRPTVRITRDTITYTIGALGSVYEAVLAKGSPTERLPLLVVFIGVITGPLFLHRDDKVKDAAKEAAQEPAPPPVPGG